MLFVIIMGITAVQFLGPEASGCTMTESDGSLTRADTRPAHPHAVVSHVLLVVVALLFLAPLVYAVSRPR